jgi:membrane carboxypeptidase/penicillin-binding protein PbpC
MKGFVQKVLVAPGLGMICVLAAGFFTILQGYVAAPSTLRQAYLHPMPLEVANLTPDQQQLLLKVQDPNFYAHSGADFSASASGWTTITEGLVKQLYFKQFHPGFLHLGKMRQILLAIGINRRVPKDEQLRLFINRVYLGNVDGRLVYGFEDAAHAYYGKQFAGLTRQEYVSLVATIVAPAEFNPATHRQENQERSARIERLVKGECASSGKSDVFYRGCAKLGAFTLRMAFRTTFAGKEELQSSAFEP